MTARALLVKAEIVSAQSRLEATGQGHVSNMAYRRIDDPSAITVRHACVTRPSSVDERHHFVPTGDRRQLMRAPHERFWSKRKLSVRNQDWRLRVKGTSRTWHTAGSTIPLRSLFVTPV